MAAKVNMFRVERYGAAGWQLYEVTVTETRYGKPEDIAREEVNRLVRIAMLRGEPVEEYDGLIRVMIWAREEDVYEQDGLPTRYPDAMVTWHKPDTSVLDAAIKAAAVARRTHVDLNGSVFRGGNNQYAHGAYEGALAVARAVHEAHFARTKEGYRDVFDMIETVSALLPDHR